MVNNIYVFVKIIFKKMDKNPRLFRKMEVRQISGVWLSNHTAVQIVLQLNNDNEELGHVGMLL